MSITKACGTTAYACLVLKKRTFNIIEFMIGESGTVVSEALCSDKRFVGSEWVTLGRRSDRLLNDSFTCPLIGEYKGHLPDLPHLCALSVTFCGRQPNMMKYTVHRCDNMSEVVEERRYLCYGGWKEGQMVYTLLKRLDIPQKECFVGVQEEGKGNWIVEAGNSCERGKNPVKSGMLLTYTADICVEWNPFNNGIDVTTKKEYNERLITEQSTPEKGTKSVVTTSLTSFMGMNKKESAIIEEMRNDPQEYIEVKSSGCQIILKNIFFIIFFIII